MSEAPIRGMTADQLTGVFQDPARQNTQLAFNADGHRHYLMFDTNHLRALMPQLVRAALPEDAPDLAITAKGLRMHVRANGEAMLTLVDAGGAEMTFGLQAHQLTQLVRMIGEAQQHQARLAAGG